MRQVGFLYEVTAGVNPYREMKCARFYRVVEMSKYLAKHDIRLLIYSPLHVDHATQTVHGYYLQGEKFHEITAPVPKVNANWYFGSWKSYDTAGNRAKSFKEWTAENQIQVYLPWAFKDMVDDKRASYEVVSEYDENFMGYSEVYQYTQDQVEKFLEKGDSFFLKPFHSSQGRDIMVVRKMKKGLKLTYYTTDETHIIFRPKVSGLFNEIKRYVGKNNIIIQQGIETIKTHGSSFDIRVIMLNDGNNWHCMHHVRTGPNGSDLSYNPNEYGSVETEQVLIELFGASKTQEIIKQVEEKSHQLSCHLATHAPGQVMELAYDILVDQTGRLFLAETNSQPGLWYDKPFTDIFNLTADEQPKYDRQIAPHGKCLAMFMHNRLNQFE